MNCKTAKTDIKRTSKEIRHLSYTERKSYNDKLNDLLDKINAFKSFLKDKTNSISTLNSKLERLTWYSDLDEECLEIISGIIAMVKDLHSILIRYYNDFNELRSNDIALEELNCFKSVIDDLEEINCDIESVFFELPFNDEFQEVNRKLSLL